MSRAFRGGLHVEAHHAAQVPPGGRRDASELRGAEVQRDEQVQQGERVQRDAHREPRTPVEHARRVQHDSRAAAASARARPHRDDAHRRYRRRDATERSAACSNAEWNRGEARDDRPCSLGTQAESSEQRPAERPDDARAPNPEADGDRPCGASRSSAEHSDAARSCADSSQPPHRARPAPADARHVAHQSRNGAAPAKLRGGRPQPQRAVAQDAPVHDAAQARELKQAWRRGDGRSCAVRTYPAL